MTEPVRSLRRLFSPQLRPGEHVIAARRAYAAGTGTWLVVGLLAGALIGWLVGIYLDAAHLPWPTLGAMAGIIAGYVFAETVARQPSGPGATLLHLLITSERLLILRHHGIFRLRILRSIELADIRTHETRPLPVGRYHRQQVMTVGGAVISLVVVGRLPIEGVNEHRSSG